MITNLSRSPRNVSIVTLSWLICQYGELPVEANPGVGTVSQGSASFNTSGSQETITTSGNAFINWNSFNINAGETTTFVEPSASSIVWNDINGGSASQILGNLNANGYVILQNQSGFYVGGQAAISVHGLILTTAPIPAPELSSGGAWEFDAPAPTAKIINYGQINITGGGPAFLIAGDIENNGTISAPSGSIGLYAGEQVYISTAPNGLGLSARVTLPQGSVDNEGKLIADGGAIAAEAQTINQNGLVQANSMQNINGTIELVGSDAVNLGANSAISAQGGSTGISSGGSVTIQAGNTFSDQTGSSINISGGVQGGNAGQVEISAPQMSSIQSSINGQANAGYSEAGLSIDTDNILLNSDGSTSPGALALNVNSLSSGFSQVNLQAADDINLDALWNLTPENGGGTVSLQAGDTINVPHGTGIEADSGRITLAAPSVNLDGTLQANSIGQANGVIEVNAGESLNIGANSVISANGDPTAANGSPGGFLVLQSGGTYADTATSTINVTGQNGGLNGIVDIIGNGTVQSPIGNTFATLINPYDLTISSSPTAGSSSPNDWNFNVNDLGNYSQIVLHALDDITLNTAWTLASSTAGSWLNLSAGNDVTLNDGTSINAGNNWNVNLLAGTAFLPSAAHAAPVSGSDGIYLNGSAYIQTTDGNISLSAANEVQVGYGSFNDQAGFSGIRTLDGGNINVTAQFGEVNTGSNPIGFTYGSKAPYFAASSTLGGISTVDGGNVIITAGGDVISYLPGSTDTGDAGSGAFGTAPGNVMITAGGSVYGHYVLVNGVGTITAGDNIGSDLGEAFALSLVNGTWNVNAPNGNIYLQEVRNPNGDFNDVLNTSGLHPKPNPGLHLFDYAPDAAVDLNAGDGVYLTSSDVPRDASSIGTPQIQVIYPPILDITAGAGGINLEGNVTLFPSTDQTLALTTTAGGNLVAPVEAPDDTITLLMSDSSQTQWIYNPNQGSTAIVPFSVQDNSTGLPVQSGNPNPVNINISGSIENLDLITSKATEITVGGNMINSGFSGQNLSASDVTSITVAGQIYNQSSFSYVNNVTIPSVPAADLLPGMSSSWDDVFYLAVNPAALVGLTLSGNPSSSQWAQDILESTSLTGSPVSVFGVTFTKGAVSGVGFGLIGNAQGSAGFNYNPATGQLGYVDAMPASVLLALEQPITILKLVNGVPVPTTVVNPNGTTSTTWETTTVNWAPPSVVQTLYANNLGVPNLGDPAMGYQLGGPGQFDIDAGSIDLGSSIGIVSFGVNSQGSSLDRYGNLVSVTPEGATVNVTVAGDLDLLSSTIATLGGGDVNVTSTAGSMDLGFVNLPDQSTRQIGFGVYSADQGNVNVSALEDIDIGGSRIAAYDGGNIYVESLQGDINVGSGADSQNSVQLSYTDPNGNANYYTEFVFGSGILATTLVTPESGASYSSLGSDWPVDHATVPGNITVKTPQGNITATLGGITQQALDGNQASGPTVTLVAGTPASADSPGYVGNIDLGQGGVIGGTVNATANGNISGLIVSRQNSDINAAQNFSGSVLAGGSADVGAGGNVSGVIVGIGGATVSGGNVSGADVISQNANVNGASSDTLGVTATATSTSQSAAQQANSTSQQLATNDYASDDDSTRKYKKAQLMQPIKRVTVILPKI